MQIKTFLQSELTDELNTSQEVDGREREREREREIRYDLFHCKKITLLNELLAHLE